MPRPDLGHVADRKIEPNVMQGSDCYTSSRTIEGVGRLMLVRMDHCQGSDHCRTSDRRLLDMFSAEPTKEGWLALSYVVPQVPSMEPGEATELAEARMTGMDNGQETTPLPFPGILEGSLTLRTSS